MISVLVIVIVIVIVIGCLNIWRNGNSNSNRLFKYMT